MKESLPLGSIVSVVGAGAMGAGIAQVAAQAGHPVRIYDMREGAAVKAIEGISAQLQSRVEKGKLTSEEHSAILGRIGAAETLQALADSSLIIEAIVEQRQAKQALFSELEALCPATTVLASNTSSISITALAASMKYPARVIGLHFFNPAPLMALVEVVSGLATDTKLIDCMVATVTAWGKTPVVCRSTPGFIVNRVARPFYAESMRLLQEGASDCATLDALLREAGSFRMGAFELTDLIGHDVNYAVTRSVFDAFYGDFRFQPSLIQHELVEAGFFGRKSGRGFYDYSSTVEKPQPRQLVAVGSPLTCIAEGDLGPAKSLLIRFRQAGISIVERPGEGVLRVGSAVLALSDGRLASQRARDHHFSNLALFDLAHDYSTVTSLGVAFSASTPDEAKQAVVDLLVGAGIKVRPLADVPGLVVLRTVVMLANEAADTLLQQVANARDIDLAMCAGVNYPSGPLAWADRLGAEWVVNVLKCLQSVYGEDRYRPSMLLSRIATEGALFHAD
jgi:3-hydroxybutyryl-CoA dehydrogenase